MRIKGLLSAVIAATTAFIANGEQRCRVLHPDPAALRARIEGSEAARLPYLKAAVAKESQLNVVDVLVGYDLSAQTWLVANAKGTPETFAASIIDEMNLCLKNTELNSYFRFRLAGVVLVGVDVSAQSIGQTLVSDLVTPEGTVPHKSGEWAKVAEAREAVGADIVSFWVDSPWDNVGISYSLEDDAVFQYSSHPELIYTFGDWAYSVCAIGSVASDFTALHEIGHIMGCGHANATQVNVDMISPGPQLYSYSSGYHFAIGKRCYNTIMAYMFDGFGNFYDSIPFFSSGDSNHTYDGVPVGDADRDNTRTLRQTYSYVAQYRVSKLSPDVPPEVDPDAPVVSDMTFKKAQTVSGLLRYADGGIAGQVEVKLGKISAKKQTVSVSAAATMLDGKKLTAKSVTVKVGYGNTINTTLRFKAPIGDMVIAVASSGALVLEGVDYAMTKGDVGGNLQNGTMEFSVDIGSLPDFGAGWDVLDVALPGRVSLKVTGGKKLDAGKAATLKYKRVKVDGETRYVLDGLDDEKKPNSSGLKITYTPKTGIFKGSFSIYATNEAVTPGGKQPKLKKFAVNFTGLVVGGKGAGQATLKKPAAGPWTVTIE